jgi:adenylate kinase
VLDNYNFDEQILQYADMLGIPAKTMNSPEVRDSLRKAKRDAQAKQQQMAEASAMAETMNKGAGAVKNMGTTPVGQNSALDSVLAGITGRI